MAISKEEVKHIAYLARLQLKEEEIKRYQRELSEILDFVHLLSELGKRTRGIKNQRVAVSNSFRDDKRKKRRAQKRKDLLYSELLEKNYLKIPLIFKNDSF